MNASTGHTEPLGEGRRSDDQSPGATAAIVVQPMAGGDDRARALATRLRVPYRAEPNADDRLVLACRPAHLSIRWTRAGAPGPVAVDFAALAPRAKHPLGRNEPLARAVGVGRGTQTVVDANAGLGRDAFVLACCGVEIWALERHAVVYELLRDGWERLQLEPTLAARVADRLTVEPADARDWLARVDEATRPDAVCLDPMLGTHDSSALVKKEMQLFRELLGADPDAAELLAIARRAARRRVAVKRPLRAPPIAADVDAVVRSRRVRWDIYLA
ncbi:MAG: class I SAM-dependent methyltransferase [Planctomycetota bacterium]